ncbi:hypothetical protein F4821DRAFT_242623 [Hypoxylon rubiginosum]|uniref:Uncharacterized protein n=1 Tax=Hypoxylon rubiginosum TaxID=110542 RepID=A0ACC0CVK6_9PEZI|nr:hypothetical protein F4821DRAFT_242623 [Hypoxylon rubiginosum]
MTSYPTEREEESIPGSFPVTPGEQDIMASSGRNKLHKADDPRGWSEEERAARGHQYTDSGVGLTDSSSRTPYSQPRDSATTAGFYDSNKGAISQNRETVPATNPTTTFGTNPTTTSGSTDYRSVDSKPGVMTGAYSRLDNSSSGSNYPESTTRDPAYQSHSNATGAEAVNPAIGVATTAPLSNTGETDSNSSGRNIVRSGLKGNTDLDHEDPYWGDVPRGAGVYNTVTGHGSSEKPADGSILARDPRHGYDDQRAFPLHDSSNTATRGETSPHNSSRFKEGLAESGAGAGAGIAASELSGKQHDWKHEKEAKEPTTHKHETAEPKKEGIIASLFHRGDHKDEDNKHEKKHEAKEEKREAKEEKHEARELKHEAKHEQKLNAKGPAKDDKPLTDRDAGVALAAASTAYGAKGQSDKHDRRHRESETGFKENSPNALYRHPNEKVADKPAQGTSTQHQQGNDPFIAAGYTGLIGQHPSQATGDSYPSSGDATTRGNPLTSQTAEKSSQHDNSKVGYGLAAAGAGAGAGYAAHKHANRDEDSYKVPVTGSSYNNNPSTTSRTVPQQSDAGYTIGEPRLGVMSGTSGATRPSEQQSVPGTNTITGTSSSAYPSQAGSGYPSQTGGGYQSQTGGAYPSQTGTTHHDKYNTLSDGTPSGVDIGNHHGDKKNVAPTSSTSYTTDPNRATRDNHSGAKATAAGAGVAGAGAAAYYGSHRDSDKPATSESRLPVASSSRQAREPYTDSATTRDATTSAHAGQYKELPTGTPSGVATDNTRHERAVGAIASPTTTSRDPTTTSRDTTIPSRDHNTTSRDPTRDNTDSHRGTKAAAAAGALGAGAAAGKHHHDSEQSRNVATSDFAGASKHASAPRTGDTSTSGPDLARTSTDSSHGGQYNVLSSGTPSGINIGDHHGDAKNTSSTTGAAVPTTTSTSTARSVEPTSSAYHPTAASTAREVKREEPRKEKSDVVKPAAAAAAAAAPSSARGDKVLHRCTKCGTDNDITGYFQEKKH